jgi:hypothetical protein
MRSFGWRVALFALVVFAVGLLVDRVLLASVEVAGSRLADLPLAPLMRGLAAALTAIAVALVVRSSHLRGLALGGALLAAVWGVAGLLPFIESWVFLDLSPGEHGVIAFLGVSNALVVTFVAVWLWGREEPSSANPPSRVFGAWGWIWRTLVCAICYVVLYLAAGIAVFPFVRAYYESSGRLPDPAILPPLQLARGVLYVLVLLPLVRSLVAGRGRTALAAAVFVPVFAGVAALLLPNPILPDHIRPYHLVEIGISNFIYGGLIGWLFWSGRRGPGTHQPAG